MPETISGPSTQFLGESIGKLSRSPDTAAVQLPLFPSGQQTFRPGQPDFTPRGDVNTDFRPKEGNVNSAPEPAAPLQSEIRSTPMSSRLGAVVQSEEIAESLGAVCLEWSEALRSGSWSATELRQTVQQDVGLVNALVSAFATMTPQKVAVISETKKLKDRKDEKSRVRRWRLHGYSRKRDNQPTGAPSPRKIDNVVSVRRVNDIISQGIHALTVQAIAMLGSREGTGFAAFGQAYARNDAGVLSRVGLDVDGYPVSAGDAHDPTRWEFRWPDQPPAAPLLGDALLCPVATTEGIGRDRVMRVRDAVELVNNRLDQWLLRVRNYRGEFPEFRIVAGQVSDEIITSQLDEYALRHWRAQNLLRMLDGWRLTAGTKMENAVYDAAYVGPSERVRTGPQIVQTRRDISRVPYNSWFEFSGYDAFRAAPGRPALPAAEWERRYRARLAKRRKTGRRRGGSGVTVPKTKHPRPHQVRDLSHGA